MADMTVEMGTPTLWGASDYSDASSGITKTHALTLTSLASAAARQGEKADLGANRAGGYAVKACFSPSSAPTAGTYVEYYWSSSYSATNIVGNDGGTATSGVDSAWVPGAGAEADINEFKQQLTFIGILPMTADWLPQTKTINGYFTPPTRYGFPVVKNATGVAASGAGVNMYVALIPIIDDGATS